MNRSVGAIPTTLNDMKKAIEDMKKEKKARKPKKSITPEAVAASLVTLKATDHINNEHKRLGSVFMNAEEIRAHALTIYEKSGVESLSVSRMVITGRVMALRQQTTNMTVAVARDGAERAGRKRDKIYVYEDCRILLHGQDHAMNRVEQGADMNTDLSVNHHFVYMLR
tara:strand:- start:242 stop:745 length:504 start_codon:yes stop_codon:yes gene_type:complete